MFILPIGDTTFSIQVTSWIWYGCTLWISGIWSGNSVFGWFHENFDWRVCEVVAGPTHQHPSSSVAAIQGNSRSPTGTGSWCQDHWMHSALCRGTVAFTVTWNHWMYSTLYRQCHIQSYLKTLQFYIQFQLNSVWVHWLLSCPQCSSMHSVQNNNDHMSLPCMWLVLATKPIVRFSWNSIQQFFKVGFEQTWIPQKSVEWQSYSSWGHKRVSAFNSIFRDWFQWNEV